MAAGARPADQPRGRPTGPGLLSPIRAIRAWQAGRLTLMPRCRTQTTSFYGVRTPVYRVHTDVLAKTETGGGDPDGESGPGRPPHEGFPSFALVEAVDTLCSIRGLGSHDSRPNVSLRSRPEPTTADPRYRARRRAPLLAVEGTSTSGAAWVPNAAR